MLTEASNLADFLFTVPNTPSPMRGSLGESGAPRTPRLLHWADELLEGDPPGPTPFLVDGLWVEGAIGPLLGPPKAGKTWLILELGLSIASGRPALGEFTVPQPGPVIVVLEESGLQAARRRLHSLNKGHGEQDVPHLLALSANASVRLDDAEWRERLATAVQVTLPRAVLLDPFVRLKGEVDENSQRELEPVLAFLRELRDICGSAVFFAAHTGHERGRRIRGSSDLEAFWESKISLGTGTKGVVQLIAEHRETDVRTSFRYRLISDAATGVVRLSNAEAGANLVGRIETYLLASPGSSTEQVVSGVKGRAEDLRAALRTAEREGRLLHEQVEGHDRRGRRRVVSAWFAAEPNGSTAAPSSWTGGDAGTLGV